MATSVNTEDEDLYVIDEEPTVYNKVVHCEWIPIVPGTLRLKIGRRVFRDDKRGRLKGVGTVNYETGYVTLCYQPKAKVTASYKFSIE